MSNDRFRKAMGHIDDQLLERHSAFDEQLPRYRKKRQLFRRLTAAAACLAILLAGTGLWSYFAPPANLTTYTADQMRGFFGWRIGGALPEKPLLSATLSAEAAAELVPVPIDFYLPVYGNAEYPQEPPLDEEELTAFIDCHLPGIAAALGYPTPQYTLSQTFSLKTEMELGPYKVTASQQSYQLDDMNHIGIRAKSGQSVTLNGKALQLTYYEDRAEQQQALEALRADICALFGKAYSDVKFIHNYKSSNGRAYVTARFYNHDAHILNNYVDWCMTDFIYANFEITAAADTAPIIMNCTDLRYYQHRLPTDQRYPEIGSARRLLIAEALELVKKGYVFGGTHCYLCAREAGSAEFSDYDHVALLYIQGPPNNIGGALTNSIDYIYFPFYAFYKESGQTPSGETRYTVALVPAVEVSGLDAFFEKYASNHSKH